MDNTITKKQMILEVAKHLYYENGFVSTSFDEIAVALGIKKTLVQYHYVTKANLGNEIYGDYSLKQFNVFSEKVKRLKVPYSFPEILIAYTIKTVQYYQQDTKAFRFYKEFFCNAFEYVITRLEDLHPVAGIRDDMSKEYIHATAITIQYALRGLIYHYINGEIKMSKPEFEGFLIHMMLSSGIYGDVKTDEIIKHVDELNSRIKIDFAPDFEWQ